MLIEAWRRHYDCVRPHGGLINGHRSNAGVTTMCSLSLLFPVGAAYALIYYAVFRYFIVRFDLATPGREPASAAPLPALDIGGDGRASRFVEALGGRANLEAIDACTTRLRLIVRDQAAVDEGGLKRLGARGVIRPSPRDLQVVIGPTADQLARDMREVSSEREGKSGFDPLARAFGGVYNIRSATVQAGRIVVMLVDPDRADGSAIDAASPRGAVEIKPNRWQIIAGPTADDVVRALQQ